MAETGPPDIRVYTTRPSYGTRPSYVRFKVLILMLIKKNGTFWDVTPRRKVISYRSFDRLYWLYIQVQVLFLYCLTLNMDHYAPSYGVTSQKTSIMYYVLSMWV